MKAFDNLAHEAKHEKPQGIQWNRYPENRPTKVGYYAVYAPFFESWRRAYWDDGWTIRFPGGWLMKVPDVYHWAQINLPNQ
jgi:hypothetical protein